MNCLFNLASPFGESLRFERLTGRESVSELFEFELTCTSEERGLAPTSALGEPSVERLQKLDAHVHLNILSQLTELDIMADVAQVARGRALRRSTAADDHSPWGGAPQAHPMRTSARASIRAGRHPSRRGHRAHRPAGTVDQGQVPRDRS